MKIITTVKITKWHLFLLSFVVLFFLGLWFLKQSGYGLSYQVSHSMPKGFYWISPSKFYLKGDRVIFTPPRDALLFLKTHHWIPTQGILMKEIMGASGDHICLKNKKVWINQKPITEIQSEYAPHQPLPTLQFCRMLYSDEYWLMSTQSPRSFDSRYFGPIQKNQIRGKAKLLYAIQEH